MGWHAACFGRSTSILGRLLLSVALTLDHIFEWMVVVFVAASLCAIVVYYYVNDVDNNNHPKFVFTSCLLVKNSTSKLKNILIQALQATSYSVCYVACEAQISKDWIVK